MNTEKKLRMRKNNNFKNKIDSKAKEIMRLMIKNSH